MHKMRKNISPMFRARLPRVPVHRYGIRFNSGKQVPESAEEAQKRKEEAAKLAVQSIKDIGTMFSGTEDKETEVIDTRPIFEDPKKFDGLSLIHQGQVLKELQTKFDGKWTKLTLQDKKLAYFIYYGNWGVRDKFDNWDKNERPFDLPFNHPIRKANADPSDTIKKLPPHYLAETPVRKPQFDTRQLDPITKFFIFTTVIVLLLGLIRDKKVGEAGRPKELVVKDLYEEQRQERLKQEEEKKAQSQKKWYYLWLK